MKFSYCDNCANCRGLKNGIFVCDAFPDGVRYDHAFKDLEELKECNNGIDYKPKEGGTFW